MTVDGGQLQDEAYSLRAWGKRIEPLYIEAGKTRWMSVVLTLWSVFIAGLMVWQVFQHDMWRDELQAYVIARDSHSLAELFTNLSFECAPPLWHLVLKGLQFFTADPIAMQFLHVGIALISVVMIVRYAPFHPVLKILLIASYPFAFQFAVIGRCYAIGIAFALAALLARDRGKPWLYWLLLGVAGHSTILLICIVSMLALERLLSVPLDVWRERGWVVVYVLLTLFAIWVALPHADRLRIEDIDNSRPLWTFFQSLDAATGGVFHISGTLGSWLFFSVFAALSAAVLAFRWKVIVAFAFGVGAFLFVDRFGYPLSYYHQMLLPVGLVLLAWQAGTLRRLYANMALALLFSVLFINGVQILTSRSPVPFSQSRFVSSWIQGNRLQDAFWIAVPHYTATPVSAYTGMYFYFPQTHSMGAAPRWTKDNVVTLSIPQVLSEAQKVMDQKDLYETWLLLGNIWPLEAHRQIIAPTGMRVELVKIFGGAAVGDEQYFVYHLIRT